MKKKITPARRLDDIKEYYFARKLREIAEMRAHGADIISLGIGGPVDAPPSEAVERLCDAAKRPDTHSYQPFAGLPQLRQAFARWYGERYGVDLDPEHELLPLLGSKEAVMHLSLTFLNPGDGVLVPNPGYPTYTSASKLAMARVVAYDLLEQNGWQPDFDKLEALDLQGVKMMWLNYPNMPTGARARRETFERAVAFGRKHGIVIVHDNPYSFILNDKPLSILQVEGAKEVAVELNSLSKSHNMAGWRMAMIASNPEFISWFVKVKSNVDSGMFRPVMEGACAALAVESQWYVGLNRAYAPRRHMAELIMRELGCEYDPEQSGMFLWGRIPESETSSETLCDRVLIRAGVFITPGFIFGSNGERYVRISLCATTENMKEALHRIKTRL